MGRFDSITSPNIVPSIDIMMPRFFCWRFFILSDEIEWK
jgi:hypothetical protein